MDLLCTENLRNDYGNELTQEHTQAQEGACTHIQSLETLQPHPQPHTTAATTTSTVNHVALDYLQKEQQTHVVSGAPSPYSSSSSSLLSPVSSSPSSGYNSATSNSSHANQSHLHHSHQHQQLGMHHHQHQQQQQIQQQQQQQQNEQNYHRHQEALPPQLYEDANTSNNASYIKTLLCRNMDYVNIATKDPTFLTDRCLENALKAEEKLPQPVCTYFKTVQKDITPPMRKIVAEWMMEVCAEEKCQEEVVLLALNYMDRFLSTKSVRKTHLQILAAACLLLASKLREPSCRALSAELLVFYTDNSIYKGDLIKWELFVLSRLGWDLSSVTPLDFLELLLIRLPIKSNECHDLSLDKVRQHAQAFICLAAKEHYFSIYSASTIAGASIAAALSGLNWHLRTGQNLRHLLNLLTDLTSIEQDYLHECMLKMESIFEEHSRNLQPFINSADPYNQQQHLQQQKEHHRHNHNHHQRSQPTHSSHHHNHHHHHQHKHQSQTIAEQVVPSAPVTTHRLYHGTNNGVKTGTILPDLTQTCKF